MVSHSLLDDVKFHHVDCLVTWFIFPWITHLLQRLVADSWHVHFDTRSQRASRGAHCLLRAHRDLDDPFLASVFFTAHLSSVIEVQVFNVLLHETLLNHVFRKLASSVLTTGSKKRVRWDFGDPFLASELQAIKSTFASPMNEQVFVR